MKIGIVGLPPQNVLDQYNGNIFIDIDQPIKGIKITEADRYIPKVYCATLRTIISNAIKIDLDLLIAGVGECKCDGMRFISSILKEIVSYPIIETRNFSLDRKGNQISTSGLTLLKKVELIIATVIRNLTNEEYQTISYVKPIAGFWGVPPHDFQLLELFPDRTHVYGWARCMENKTPADKELELFVDKEIPTIFYAQSFCQKNVLARYLAQKHNGLYIETDESLNNSTKAKIEAFLEFRVKV